MDAIDKIQLMYNDDYNDIKNINTVNNIESLYMIYMSVIYNDIKEYKKRQNNISVWQYVLNIACILTGIASFVIILSDNSIGLFLAVLTLIYVWIAGVLIYMHRSNEKTFVKYATEVSILLFEVRATDDISSKQKIVYFKRCSDYIKNKIGD